nr:hypothetical protein [Tanacetum cinerariifolium]
DANNDECFNSGGDDDKINDFEDGYYDSEGDILYLESLLDDDLVHHDPSIPSISVASILEGFTDVSPLEENDELFDLEPKNDDWKKILYDAPILMTKDKIFDLRILDQNFSPTYIFSSTCFTPNIMMIWGESSYRLAQKQALLGRIAPDLEASHARSFVHRPLELLSLYGNLIS